MNTKILYGQLIDDNVFSSFLAYSMKKTMCHGNLQVNLPLVKMHSHPAYAISFYISSRAEIIKGRSFV